MKILYVGHPAHRWSGSSRFFQEILEKLGSVTYLAPTTITAEDDLLFALESDFDLYVFFQFDFMAYAFLHAGKNVLVVPMVDGSGGFGLRHWRLLKDAKFITFSKNLDKFLKLQNMNTHNIQFWPKAQNYSKPTSEAVYFWPRIYDFPITVAEINRLFMGSVPITVRLLSDDPAEIDALGPLPETVNLKRIYSREEHIEEIKLSSVFIAPRKSEGIGLSFLEALSLGRPVIAYNYPVMSEYILHGVTGVLLNSRSTVIDPYADWEQMGRSANKSVVTGRENYLQSIFGLEKYILSPFKKKKIKSIHKTLDLLNLSVKIYKEETHINGNLSLNSFVRARPRIGI